MLIRYGLRSLLARKTTSLAAGLGVAMVTFVLAATLLAFVHISMINYATWSELSFGFQPTWQALVTAGVFGIGMGLVGGLFPALRAMRMSPLQALRH